MPHFTFDIEVNDAFPDPAGTALPSAEAAQRYAVAIAATHLHEAGLSAARRVVRVIIKDEAGEAVAVLESVLDDPNAKLAAKDPNGDGQA